MPNLELRLLSAEEMNQVYHPEGTMWPVDSFWICAFDEHGKLKGRLGMIAVPHAEAPWVAHDQLGTGLIDAMVEKLEELVKEKLGRNCILAFTTERANGLHQFLLKRGWKDLNLKVFQKEL